MLVNNIGTHALPDIYLLTLEHYVYISSKALLPVLIRTECWKCYIVVIPCALVVHLIYTPSGFKCIYQENHSCPWRNY